MPFLSGMMSDHLPNILVKTVFCFGAMITYFRETLGHATRGFVILHVLQHIEPAQVSPEVIAKKGLLPMIEINLDLVDDEVRFQPQVERCITRIDVVPRSWQ